MSKKWHVELGVVYRSALCRIIGQHYAEDTTIVSVTSSQR